MEKFYDTGISFLPMPGDMISEILFPLPLQISFDCDVKLHLKLKLIFFYLELSEVNLLYGAAYIFRPKILPLAPDMQEVSSS